MNITKIEQSIIIFMKIPLKVSIPKKVKQLIYLKQKNLH